MSWLLNNEQQLLPDSALELFHSDQQQQESE